MPITGRSFEIASSTSFTDFLRPTSIGMIDPGNNTEFRSGRIEMISGTSTGPSGAAFLDAMSSIVYGSEAVGQSLPVPIRRREVRNPLRVPSQTVGSDRQSLSAPDAIYRDFFSLAGL